MILKVISKYGLAAHLGLLAAFPVAFSLVLGADALGKVMLWLSLFAVVWVFFDPSIRIGERSSEARIRVASSIIRDPVFYIFVAISVFALVRWLNSGITLWYDAEQSVWVVKSASAPMLPASTADAGFLPMAASVALLVVVIGVRHALGLSARLFCGLTAVSVTGLGGLVSSVCACLGKDASFIQAARADFMHTPFVGVAFGVFLLVAVAFGAAAESRKWAYARLPYVLAVAGTSSGLVFFAPPAAAAVCLTVILLFLVFALFYCARSGTLGGCARTGVFTFLGVAISMLLIMALASSDLQQFKLQGLNPELIVPVEYGTVRDALARISRGMWLERPWCGAGVGAYPLHVPFIAVKADWSVLPANVANGLSGYWTLLAERGIVGCAFLAVGLGALVWSWGARLVAAFMFLRGNDEADIFPFACPPVVWTAPFVLALAVAEMMFSNSFASPASVFALIFPLALSAASFPRKVPPPVAQAGESDQDGKSL